MHACRKDTEQHQKERRTYRRKGKEKGKEKEPPPLSSEEVRENLEGIAIVGDIGGYLCRSSPSDMTLDSVTTMLGTCTTNLTLDPKLQSFIKDKHDDLLHYPERAQEIFADVRASVLVPVPDLFTERFLGPEEARARRRRR